MRVDGLGESGTDIQTSFEATVSFEGKLTRTHKPPQQTSQYSLEVTRLSVTTGEGASAVTFKFPTKDETIPSADTMTLESVKSLFDSLKELQAVEIANDGTIHFPNKSLQMSRLAEQVVYFLPLPSTGMQVSEKVEAKITFPRLQFPGAKNFEVKVTEILESVKDGEARISSKSDDGSVNLTVLFDVEKGYVKEQTGFKTQTVKYSSTSPDGEKIDVTISVKLSDWKITLKLEK